MKNRFIAYIGLLLTTISYSQSAKTKPNKYPSLLWEITGKGLSRPSYLFGTMHVSSKMVFHLSDSFYTAIKNVQVVALETNPATWQEDFSRYDLDGDNVKNRFGRFRRYTKNYAAPQDYLSINSLNLVSYEKMMEAALYSNPSIINSFLYRSNSQESSDFEEDTYLDLHIFQTGKKLGKKVCGVEDFDGSMNLVKEAYSDAAKEKNKTQRNEDFDEGFSYAHMEEAYRAGNLDLLDTINKVNSQSAAFDEKFLYKRNDNQARSIDSILRTGVSLFVGVGAAHLPGERGVIEQLRRKGYKLRPVKMNEKYNHEKDDIEKIKVPVQFTRQTADDGFYSVNVPGKLYNFGRTEEGLEINQFTDMVNGSYYMITRIITNAAILGQSEAAVERKLDSVLYENIPGKILSKKAIEKNGYRGFDITNRTRRGDVQRYNIFVTPFYLLVFKMSGNGNYVGLGKEANQFFNSIQLKEAKPEWRTYTPSFGGFEAEFPHQPLLFKNDAWNFAAYDAVTKTGFEINRNDVHNYNFLEEDSFDLNLMEESFASSDFIQKNLNRTWTKVGRYPALDVKYQYKDNSVAQVRFLINGPHYYTLIAHARTENKSMLQFIRSFVVKPFIYTQEKKQTDSTLHFTVKSPVVLEKKKKLEMYPEDANYNVGDDDDSLIDNGKYVDKVVGNDSSGEKIYVSFYRPSQYYFEQQPRKDDSTRFKKEWVVRSKKVDTLQDKTVVVDYELGNKLSSRMLKEKTFIKDGMGYKLQTELDTLSASSAFIHSFFQSFEPVDALKGVDIKKKKSALFFSQFFSSDTLLHKRAIKNINGIKLDSSDFPQLQRAIESLSWKEKDYLNVKKDFLGLLASIPTKDAANYLKAVYYNAGDTVDLQYAVLETLLQQRTTYAYKTVGDILQADPPILNFEIGANSNYSAKNIEREDDDVMSRNQNGSFLDNLTDTLQLTAGIFKKISPLMNIDDYERPIMNLTGELIDSSLIDAKDYETYLPKFILEARQTLKKQLIQEKYKAIEKATNANEDSNDNFFKRVDKGNNKLSLYATLLLPFWDKNEQVPQIINQLLASNDKRLKYNTTVLLLRNHSHVPDTLLQYFAAMDEFRYELYTDLKQLKQLEKFPLVYKNQLFLARSRLLAEQSYNKPDTLVFLQKLPMQYKDQNGCIYFFKYKEQREDKTWKLGTVGMLPNDSTKYDFEPSATEAEEQEYDFTTLSTTKLTAETSEKEQLEKMLKRLLYSRRKSAAQFYNDNRFNDYGYSQMKF